MRASVLTLLVLQTLVYFTAASLNERNVAEATKVDCYPIAGATKEKCESLGCTWLPVPKEASQSAPRVSEPWCYHPDGFSRYNITSRSKNFITLSRTRASLMGDDDVQNLKITLKPYKLDEVLRITIEDADKPRFVPELPKLNLEKNLGRWDKSEHKFVTDGEKFSFELSVAPNSENLLQVLTVRRASTGAIVFSTDLGKLIFADKFIQLNSALSSRYVYGLGEHYDTFLKFAGVTDAYKVYSFWNTDRLPMAGGTRSYGGFPFMINLEKVGEEEESAVAVAVAVAPAAHGIYLRNSNAMDVVLQSDASVSFRPIGGVLDFFLFAGPQPLDVARQFQQLVGLPELPPRWALGFHLCRYNYNSLERTRTIWKRTRDAGIPFDVQWNDVDALGDANDFSYSNETYAGLPEFVDELHALNMHYVPLVDPGISQEDNYEPYELGTKMDVWIKNSTGGTLVGRVWNKSGRTVFPDFSSPASHEFWKQMFVAYQKVIKFDGAWIDMNDISNFVDGSLDGCPWHSDIERPQYTPGGYNLQVHSLCLSARHASGLEYDVHNLYSSYEAIATKRALEAARPGRRTLIISRSSHPGQGAHSGHWSGDVQSTWDYLRWSIPSLLEHSMYGFSLMGSDICGFAGNTTVELCARWSTLGAFYTFARNHNDDTSIDQDPVALGPLVVEANKNALSKRYSLLPYLYSLIYRAHKLGEPVARSVGFEFFSQLQQEQKKNASASADKDALLKVEHQFMWGGAVMLSPIVLEGARDKLTYLPEGRWYETDILPESMSFDVSKLKVPRILDIYGPAARRDKKDFPATDNSSWHKTSNVSLANMPIFYRGGHVIPVYAQINSTVRDTELSQPLSLEIALSDDYDNKAYGEIYLDDGESLDEDRTSRINVIATGAQISISLAADNYQKAIKFGFIKILGLRGNVHQVITRRNVSDLEVPFDQKDHVLIIDMQSVTPLSMELSIVVIISC